MKLIMENWKQYLKESQQSDEQMAAELNVYAAALEAANSHAEVNQAGNVNNVHNQTFKRAMDICIDSTQISVYPKTCAAVAAVKKALKATMARIEAKG